MSHTFCPPLFPTPEKCHLGRRRPSNWHLWQSARLKGHAPIGMGSPGCAVSGRCLLPPLLSTLLAFSKSGKISTPSNTPHPHFFFFPSSPSASFLGASECCVRLSEGFSCDFIYLFFFLSSCVLLKARLWTPKEYNLCKVSTVCFVYLFCFRADWCLLFQRKDVCIL